MMTDAAGSDQPGPPTFVKAGDHDVVIAPPQVVAVEGETRLPPWYVVTGFVVAVALIIAGLLLLWLAIRDTTRVIDSAREPVARIEANSRAIEDLERTQTCFARLRGAVDSLQGRIIVSVVDSLATTDLTIRAQQRAEAAELGQRLTAAVEALDTATAQALAGETPTDCVADFGTDSGS